MGIMSQECMLQTVSPGLIIWPRTSLFLGMNQNSPGPSQTWLTPALRLLWCGKWLSCLRSYLSTMQIPIYWWFWKWGKAQKVRLNVTLVSYTVRLIFMKEKKPTWSSFCHNRPSKVGWLANTCLVHGSDAEHIADTLLEALHLEETGMNTMGILCHLNLSALPL